MFRSLYSIAVLVFFSALSAPLWADEPSVSELSGYARDGGSGAIVYEADIEGLIDLGLAAFVERVADKAAKGDVVLLRIKTFGGRVDAAVRIRDALLGSEATVVAYIDRRAISAGALISLAADTIFMSEGASIGAATPVQGGAQGEMKPTTEKVVSYMRAEMRATAEATGRRPDIAEAMVDADIEIKDVSAKGKLLTLTSTQALKLKIADGVLPQYEDVFSSLNLQEAERVVLATHWGEKVARFLTDPTVNSLLLTFGMAGIMVELYSPGFGVGGIIGAVCLALFFLGQYAAHLAGFEEAVVFAGGIALLLLEAFVLPGFGIAGIAGLACIFAGLVMALIELNIPYEVASDLGLIQDAIELASTRMVIVLVCLVVSSMLLMRRFSTMKATQPLILKVEESGAGIKSTSVDYEALVGSRGKVMAALRPSGFVELGGERVTAMAEGDFISAGTEVEVVRAHGNEVIVKKV